MPLAPITTRRRSWLIVLAVVAALGVAAVLYTAFSASQQPGASPGVGNSASPAVFTARTLTGGQVAVPGSRPSVLLFFSVECGGCGPTAGALAEVERTAGGAANFALVDVAGYETDEDITGFLGQYRATSLSYTIDTDARLITTYRVQQLSTVLVLDAAGREVFRAVEPSAERIRAELAKVAAG